jgi:hypothetical protein
MITVTEIMEYPNIEVRIRGKDTENIKSKIKRQGLNE